MAILAIVATSIYLLVVFGCFGFIQKPVSATGIQPNEITFLLPVHNGAQALGVFLQSWMEFVPVDQPLTVVCNGGTDDSYQQAIEWSRQHSNITVLKTSRAHKKTAILKGMDQVNTPYVWMCDVDISFHGKLTDAVAHLDDTPLQLIPIKLTTNQKRLLQTTQKAEWALLQAMTHQFKKSNYATLANGGAMLVQTKVFQKLEPYADNMHWNTGDDIFLLQAMKQYGYAVRSANNLRVCSTAAPSTWGAFYQQRYRWASKNAALTDRAMRLGGFIFIMRMGLPFLILFVRPFSLGMGLLILVALVEWRFAAAYRQGQSLPTFVLGVLVLPFVYLPVLVTTLLKSIAVQRDRKKAQKAV